MKKTFKRHFRIYFKTNHPAYIVGEDDENFIFHRVTHSKTSGGKKNWEVNRNPLLKGGDGPIYIVKAEQKEKKKRFSPFKLETKRGINIEYSNIKLMIEIKK